METCASWRKACIDAPRWSQEEGMECFDGLASLIVGHNPLEVERLWYRMYRGSIYYGRRGVAIQAISAIDIALWDICGKFFNQPIHILLGAKWRDKVRAYGSTLFRFHSGRDEGRCESVRGPGLHGAQIRLGRLRRRSADGRETWWRLRREELGPRKDLLVDTDGLSERTPKEAIQVVRSIEPFTPFLVEELLHPEDYDGYRRVSEAVDTRSRAVSRKRRSGVQGSDRARRRGRAAAGSYALRRIHRGAQNRHMARPREQAGDPAFLVKRLVDSGVAPFDCLPAPCGLCRIQYVARAAEPAACERSPANGRRISASARGTGLGVEVNDGVINEYRVS